MVYSVRLFQYGIGTLAVLGTLSVALAQTQVTTSRVSVASNGAQANAWSDSPSVSANGRYVAFFSDASNLVANDTNDTSDVFVRDLQTGTTIRVSVASDGTQGDDFSDHPSISADGRYVAFESDAANLVAGDTNEAMDVFVRDIETGTTILVSVASDGTAGNGWSISPSISADGQRVAFISEATSLVSGDTNGTSDVFVWDMPTGTTTRASVASIGTQGNSGSYEASISGNGRFVAFHSLASNLVVGDTNGVTDVFTRDLQTGSTIPVSVANGGLQANKGSYHASISADGRFVAFHSLASNLVVGDTNGVRDAFVRDLQTSTTILASIFPDGSQGVQDSIDPSISADGRRVAFESGNAYLRDLQTGTTTTVSVSSTDVSGYGYGPSLSADGQGVTFMSPQNLVVNDTGGIWDVYIARPVGPRVSGMLFLLDFLGLRPSHAEFVFRDPATGAIVRTVDATLGSDGAFEANSPGPGVWDMSVKISHWLRKTVRIDVTTGDISGVIFRLLNGDIDGDNIVTVFDYVLLSDAFDSVEGDANWYVDADLDGDGAVTVFDYVILSGNFDIAGDE